IELVRAVFAGGAPFFGSCWGMQVAVTAAGGRVRANPLGREFGFARRIALSAAGRAHALFRGKPAVFEAVTVHRDDIGELPAGATVLASSDMGLQAVEMQCARSTVWAVQYHPEYGFAEIAATAQRYAPVLLEEKLFLDAAELDAWVAELRELQRTPGDARLCWKHALGPGIRDERAKLAELRNWVELQVLPRRRQRG
ncbi:MAG: gamma-glutamyl-gamma-aminobutyrate hydrolase family protein, partial [Gammaproteobacteria bacterium]|nr:gamma-glutamyl-gamma-aminobutyrate hydrolase family protein [Gammaproteobacteria bacterium]